MNRKAPALQLVSLLLLLAVLVTGCSTAKARGENSSILLEPEHDLAPYQSLHNLDAEKVEPLKDVFNILLIGVDALEEDDEDYSRSDVMIVVSIDPINDKIKLTSVLRDCFMEIPGYGKRKLNRAYTIGGEELLLETLSQNLDLPLDTYVKVGFDDFKEIIDILDGVPIALEQKETKAVLGESGEAGTYRLDSGQALDYVRLRMTDNDWYRTSRQRKLMFAIYEEGIKQTETRLFELLYKIYPLVETNLTLGDMVKLLFQYFKMDAMKLEEMYIPADGTFEEVTLEGEFVLNFDLEQNQILLNNFIYKDEIPELQLT